MLRTNPKDNRKSTKTIVRPDAFPVTIDRVKDYLRLGGSADDDMLREFIYAATEHAERFCGRYFITRTLRLSMDRPPQYSDQMADGVYDLPSNYLSGIGDVIELGHPDVQSIVQIVTYDDTNASTVFNANNYELDGSYGRVFLDEDAQWPTNLRNRNAIEIDFKVGYGDDPTDVPFSIRQSIMQHVGQMYECRGTCDLSPSCKDMLRQYKIYDFVF